MFKNVCQFRHLELNWFLPKQQCGISVFKVYSEKYLPTSTGCTGTLYIFFLFLSFPFIYFLFVCLFPHADITFVCLSSCMFACKNIYLLVSAWYIFFKNEIRYKHSVIHSFIHPFLDPSFLFLFWHSFNGWAIVFGEAPLAMELQNVWQNRHT